MRSAGARVRQPFESCGRLYEGFDVAPPLVDWCKQQLEPLVANFRFSLADIELPVYTPREW